MGRISERLGDRIGPRIGTTGRGIGKQLRGGGRKRPLDRHHDRGNVDGPWTHDKFFDDEGTKRERSRGNVSQLSKEATQVRVANLHPAASAEDIKTIFSPFGTILSVKMLNNDSKMRKHSGGEQTQSALIVYSTRAGALAAIREFHETLADGYILSVQEEEKIGASIVGAAGTRPTPSMDLSSRKDRVVPGSGLYSDRMVMDPSSRLGALVSVAAREAAQSVTTSKAPLKSRLGPPTRFSVTL